MVTSCTISTATGAVVAISAVLAVATAATTTSSSDDGQLPTVSLTFDETNGGAYTVSINSQPWYTSSPAANTLCIGGKQTSLTLVKTTKASGTDTKFGKWTGTTASYGPIDYTFKAFQDHPDVAVGTVSFPKDLDTSGW